jgi:dipeptidyl aminopeptidase/acylaminoacyl peptidase
MFTFDNENLIATSNLNRDKQALVRLDATNGDELEVIYQHPDYDVSGVNYSRKRKVLTSANYTSWKREKAFLDDQTEQLYKRLKSELGDKEIVITDHDRSEQKFVIRTYSDRSMGGYYLYNKTTDKLRKLAEVYSDIKPENMAKMKPIKYQSRDGLTIHGYLTLPPDRDTAKNLPVIVMPHGGPWTRDRWGFNSQVQFLASRGYAVFQMNYRGSTGYGRKFWEAGFKEWGQKMQDDITDGAKWLIKEGIADSNRIGIYGASYGGYATLAGVTYTPDLYTCAVDYVGVSNIFTFMETIPAYWDPLKDMLHEMIGHPQEDSLMLARYSPALNVEKIKTPLFIAQGALDPRVDKNESDQIVKALRDRGVDVPYMVKEDEGHGFRNEENRFEFYKAMIGFFKEHMPPGKSKNS